MYVYLSVCLCMCDVYSICVNDVHYCVCMSVDEGIPAEQQTPARPGGPHNVCIPAQHCSLLPGEQKVCAQVCSTVSSLSLRLGSGATLICWWKEA